MAEKKDLAVKEEMDLSLDFSSFSDVAGTGVTGFEEMDESDVKLPTYKLLQSNSQEASGKDAVGKAGQFYNVVTGDVKDSLDNVAILYISKSRSMFPSVFKKGDKVLCMSEMGGVYKRQGVGNPRGGLCKNCEYSQWGNDNEPPACKLGYVILGAIGEEELFRIHARGASVVPTKNFISTVMPKLRAGGKQLGAYAVKVNIGSEYVEGDKGNFYRLTFDIVGQVESVEKYKQFGELAEAYKDMFFEVAERDVELGNGEDIVADYEIVEDDESDESGHGGIL